MNLMVFWVWMGIGVLWCMYAWARRLDKDLYNPLMALAWPVFLLFWIAMSLDTYLHRSGNARS